MTPSLSMKMLARGGYAARGMVYLIVGGFAVMAALGSGRTVDTRQGLETLLAQPLGDVMLWLVLLGLLAFAGWRLVQGVADTDAHGRDAKGLTIRIGLLGSAVANLLLALIALGLLRSDFQAISQGGGGGEDFVTRLLGMQNSNLLIYAIALIPLGVGLAHIVKGWRAGFEKYFQADAQTMRVVRPVSRFGLIARGMVFIVIAVLLFVGGSRYEPTDPPGLKDVVQALQGLPFGTWLFLLLALGVVAFAVYSFAEAIWRRIVLPHD